MDRLTYRCFAGALYVSRHDGREVKQEDVRKLLEPYGSIEKIFVPTETERELFQLPSGMWVRFAYFQDCRDAYAVGVIPCAGE